MKEEDGEFSSGRGEQEDGVIAPGVLDKDRNRTARRPLLAEKGVATGPHSEIVEPPRGFERAVKTPAQCFLIVTLGAIDGRSTVRHHFIRQWILTFREQAAHLVDCLRKAPLFRSGGD